MPSREEIFAEQNRAIIDQIMAEPAAKSPERLAEENVAAMSSHIDGMLGNLPDHWRDTAEGGKTGRVVAMMGDVRVISDIIVIDAPNQPRTYSILTITESPDGKQMLDRQHLKWLHGDKDAYRVDGGYRNDPARADRQRKIDGYNAKAHERQASIDAANEAERQRNIPEEDKLYIMDSPSLMPSPPQRGGKDLDVALHGLTQGELQKPRQGRMRGLLLCLAGMRKG